MNDSQDTLVVFGNQSYLLLCFDESKFFLHILYLYWYNIKWNLILLEWNLLRKHNGRFCSSIDFYRNMVYSNNSETENNNCIQIIYLTPSQKINSKQQVQFQYLWSISIAKEFPKARIFLGIMTLVKTLVWVFASFRRNSLIFSDEISLNLAWYYFSLS